MSRLDPCLVLGCLLPTAVAQTFAPLGRPVDVGSPAAFDTVRRRLVLFGDEGTTWELANGALLPRVGVVGGQTPPARVSHAMCFDEARRRVLMFGGLEFTGLELDDTWVYDGSRWARLTGGPVPPARTTAAMTWDSVRGRAVLFGGTGTTPPADTWEHDGTSWLQRTSATVPGVNFGQMTFDRQRGVAVLVSANPASSAAAQTWEWNGTNWSLRASSGPVLTDDSGTLAFDAVRNRTVLAGAPDGRIWEWNGTVWAASPPLPQPFLRQSAVSWFDPGCGCVSIAGGIDPLVLSNPRRSDVWQWNGQALTQVQSDKLGPSATQGAMISDLTRGRVIHFGGQLPDGQLTSETWSWNGSAWSRVVSPTGPGTRWFPAVAHDLIRGECLLFGGGDNSTTFGDTWSLGANGWSVRSTSGPPPRTGAVMAADLVRGVVVLFGGLLSLSSSILANDTWEWNGTVWTQRTTSVRPSGRLNSAMAFHPQLGKVLLFGGTTVSSPVDDTWTWDGTQWTLLTPTTAPPILDFMSMHTVLASNRCLLVGIAGVRQQVWEYAGTTWSLVLDDAMPIQDFWWTCASGPGFDTVTCTRLGAAVAALTFEPGRVAAIGAGCGTPPASLMVRSRPISGATTGLELVANPARAVLFAIDLASGNTPLGGGCTNWLSPAFLGLFEVSDASGFASRPLSVPPDLVGLDLFAQAIVLEPQSANGLVLTEGLRLKIGR